MFRGSNFPDLLVGLAAADDAAVYRLNDRQAIISTTDFFPPVVDDPYDFGAIAAANALSDIYAMGGQFLFAINLVAFPANLDKSILREILRGGADKVAEASGVIAGGHSVNDNEPKYGLAVTGIVEPARIMRKGGARPGDRLVLTKPLGVGVITTALKREEAETTHVAAAVKSMKQLNRNASVAALQHSASAATDITGFGLIGHAQEMASQGQVDFRFNAGDMPWLPGALDYGAAAMFPGGMINNRDHFHRHVLFAESVRPLVQHMLFTPETSGGLLIALHQDKVESFQQQIPEATVIGEVTAGTGKIWIDE